MSSGARLALALALLVLGAAAWVTQDRQLRAEAESHAHASDAAALPSVALVPTRADEISELELTDPNRGAGAPSKIVLERRPDGWVLTAPIQARASGPNVQALLDNLTRLQLSQAIGSGPSYYEQYGLSDAAAFHVLARAGGARAYDLYFGKSSARGQLLRIAGNPMTYTVASGEPNGYAGFLFTRPVRSWREARIFQFDPSQALRIEIENAHGRFVFERSGDSWSGALRPRAINGELAGSRAWPKFDASRVDALLAAFRSLAADEFGDASERSSAGLEPAERSAGRLKIALKSGQIIGLRLGNPAHGPSTWGIKDSRWAVREGGEGELFALALWTTDWLTTGAGPFERRASK